MAEPAPQTDPWSWRPAGPARIQQSVALLRLDGPDSLRFLHGQTSQALELARPGQWLSTCCITPTARMRALAEVLVDEEGAWLVVTAGDGGAVRQSLDRVLFPADQVRLGPLLEGVLITPINAAGEGTALQAPPAGDPGAHWQRLPGQAGWRLGEHWLLPASEPLPAAVAELPQLTLQDQERWRLQQGLPALPGEINDDTNPFELGLAARVSLSKGCYVGQETLAKLATYDGVKQQLRRWCCPAGAALPPEASLYRADGSRAGSISTRLALPEGGWIGLALVRRPALDDDELRLGDDASGPWLRLSVPPAFAPPPVGAGGGQAQPAGGS
ncbi:MAG: YgfZ/GcvT domain-containing protein [Cyanobacteriota bacterium]